MRVGEEGAGERPEGRLTQWSYLGRVSYPDGVALQEAVRSRLRRGEGSEWLLLLEHPPVYTLGRNASAADVLFDREALAARGIEVHETDRGGQVTYHGPGQLVGYPILDLSPDRRDVRRYVADLAQTLVLTLAALGVVATARPAPLIGVWVEERKIASIGVHLSRWITTHGFALNVATDLATFGGIVACGLPTVRMTSIAAERGEAPPLERVGELYAARFGEVFGRRMKRAVISLGDPG